MTPTFYSCLPCLNNLHSACSRYPCECPCHAEKFSLLRFVVDLLTRRMEGEQVRFT